ncbi:MAG: hypothetical protein HC866_23275 [Leptolyngbyaceae cyanobacterium RU_5_1]|nr:hypothetical protein [Leptolyngbyaceae cyanobacterium RU_5_1]
MANRPVRPLNAVGEFLKTARIELDEFYQSLFGEPAAADESTAETDAIATPQSRPPALELSTSSDLQTDPAEGVFELSSSLFADEVAQPAQPEPMTLPANAESAEFPLVQADKPDVLTDLFAGVRTEEGRSVPTDPPAIAGSEAVMPDPLFIDDAPVRQSFQANNLPETTYSQESAEDQYTRAAPEENLLPDAPPGAVNLNLDLDDLTLNRLHEDLSSLESTAAQNDQNFAPATSVDSVIAPSEITPSEVAPSEVALDQVAADQPQSIELTEQPPSDEGSTPSLEEFAADFSEDRFSPILSETTSLPAMSPEPSSLTLADAGSLFEDAPPINPSPPTPGAIAPAPLTLEGMDDLFGEAPLSPIPLPCHSCDRARSTAPLYPGGHG